MPPLANSNAIDFEGHQLRVVEAGHADTESTSFLPVPALSLVLAGDIRSNDAHQWLVEATSGMPASQHWNRLRP